MGRGGEAQRKEAKRRYDEFSRSPVKEAEGGVGRWAASRVILVVLIRTLWGCGFESRSGDGASGGAEKRGKREARETVCESIWLSEKRERTEVVQRCDVDCG